MSKYLSLTLFLVFVLSSKVIAQIDLETGYYINNEGERIEGLIKNLDWKNNPTKIFFTHTGADQTNKLELADIKEFGIGDDVKYVRANVLMDRMSSDWTKLKDGDDIKFNQESILLNVLIEGNATLYEYKDVNLTRYFYQVEQSDIDQLIYYQYFDEATKVGTNEGYRQQLNKDLNCGNIVQLTKLKYEKLDLIEFFSNYNDCTNSSFIKYKGTKRQKAYNLSAKLGVKSANLLLGKVSGPITVDLKNKIGFQIGLENEFVLPFRKNKISLVVEPTFQMLKGEMETEGIQGFRDITTVDYKSIELPLGVRHYFFLNDKFRIFVNVFAEIDMRLQSDVNYYKFTNVSRKGTVGFNMSGGFGINYNSTYSFEFRYSTKRDIENQIVVNYADHNERALILGVKLY